MLCEWDAPLAVARADESAVAQPGKCVIAKRSEPLYLADAHDERLGTPAQDACALGPVIGALDVHLSPADVAAGPLLGPWSGKAGGLEFPSRSPCDEPGSGCVLWRPASPVPVVEPPLPVVVVEPPVVIDGVDVPGGGWSLSVLASHFSPGRVAEARRSDAVLGDATQRSAARC